MSPDYLTGKIRIRGDAAMADAVVKAAGIDPSLIETETAHQFHRLSRTADASPHYGGARYNMLAPGTGQCFGSCSTGFAVKNSYNVRSMITAGHCGQYPTLGYSGPFLEGILYRAGMYPNIDISVLYTPGETYTNKIYADPGSSPVTVTTGHEPILNETDCFSGGRSKETCGNLVTNINDVFCDTDGCALFLFDAIHYATPFCQDGDSGSPFYLRYFDAAAVEGTLVAGDDTGTLCLGQKLSSIVFGTGETPVNTP